MNAKDSLSLNFQLWCGNWLSPTQLLVGGGGGRAKTGFKNGIALLQLTKDNKFEELTRSLTDYEIAYSICNYKNNIWRTQGSGASLITVDKKSHDIKEVFTFTIDGAPSMFSIALTDTYVALGDFDGNVFVLSYTDKNPQVNLAYCMLCQNPQIESLESLPDTEAFKSHIHIPFPKEDTSVDFVLPASKDSKVAKHREFITGIHIYDVPSAAKSSGKSSSKSSSHTIVISHDRSLLSFILITPKKEAKQVKTITAPENTGFLASRLFYEKGKPSTFYLLVSNDDTLTFDLYSYAITAPASADEASILKQIPTKLEDFHRVLHKKDSRKESWAAFDMSSDASLIALCSNKNHLLVTSTDGKYIIADQDNLPDFMTSISFPPTVTLDTFIASRKPEAPKASEDIIPTIAVTNIAGVVSLPLEYHPRKRSTPYILLFAILLISVILVYAFVK